MRVLARAWVLVVAAATLSVVPALPAGAAESAVGWMVDLGGVGFETAMDPVRNVAYVSVPSRNEIVVVSLTDHRVVQRFATGRVYGIALSTDRETLFAAVAGPGEVLALDVDTGSITRYDVAAKLDDGPTWDVIQPVAGEVWVSGNPGSGGFAYIVRVDLASGVQTRVASSQIIRAGPVFETDGTWVYIGEGFSPNSLYRVSVATGQIVAEDDHGGVSGTTHLALSPDGTHITTASGQELATSTIRQTGVYAGGIPHYSADGTQMFVLRSSYYDTPNPAVIDHFARGSGQPLDRITTSCRLASGSRMTDFDIIDDGGFLVLADATLCITQPPGPAITCAGRAATMIGTPDDDVLRGTTGDDVIAGLGGDDVLDGLAANDSLCGGDGEDILIGGDGNDTVVGNGDRDVAWFARAAAAINVDLASGTGSGQGSDALASVEDVMGTRFPDTLTGDASHNTLWGRDGNDVIRGGVGDDELDGGGGADTVSYALAPGGVSADLAAGWASGEGDDQLLGVENLEGSSFADSFTGNDTVNRLVGNAGADQLHGNTGDDVLLGGGGNDTLTGGGGRDVASYVDSPAAVTVNLAAGTASGHGNDVLTGVVVVVGSAFEDQLTGDAYRNILSGGPSVDVIYGQGGPDTLNGDEGNDRMYAGEGDDNLRGGAGYDELRGGWGYDALNGGLDLDTCLTGEHVRNCEA